MLKWIHHLLNPHCPDCAAEKAASNVCNSCETLRYEVERLRADNERLLSRVLEKPEKEPERTIAPEPTTEIRPRQIPWAVRRQMLEAEDKRKAILLANAPKPDESIADLEKEMGIAEQERENATGKR